MTLHPTQTQHLCFLITRINSVLFAHASPSSMCIFEFKLYINIEFVDRDEQSHLKHDMQEVDSCVVVPSVQTSWAMLLLQKLKKGDVIINPETNMLRTSSIFQEVYWCQPNPFDVKTSLAYYLKKFVNNNTTKTHSWGESLVGNRSLKVRCFMINWAVPKCF